MTDMRALGRYPRFRLDVEMFLSRYWQKRPLLIREAIVDFEPPIDASTLAGLAMEEGIDSRIVECEDQTWRLEHGPFSADDFQRQHPWTLLVQGVDSWIPEVAALRGCVDFLPNWRFDDIMVSYAADGGSVGPHFDRYDVFLLQGEGERLWRIGECCDDTTPSLGHDDLNLLRHFVTLEEYLLGPGDVLYIPPGYAHWGIAQGPCTTFSLGFRAPRVGDLMARLTDSALESIQPELLLEDRNSIDGEGRPGELTEVQRRNARDAVLTSLEALDDGVWLGELLTEPSADDDEDRDEPLPAVVVQDPCRRLLWFESEGGIEVFAAGGRTRVPHRLLDLLTDLCAGRRVSTGSLGSADRSLVTYLWSCGVLLRPEDLQ